MTDKKIFMRSFIISFVVFICLFAGGISAARIYENISVIRYGEYKKAIEIKEDYLRIFDYEIKK